MPRPTPTTVRRARLADCEQEDVAARGAKRHADADLVRALRNHVRHHAVDANDREQQRQAAENQHDRAHVLQSDRPLEQRLAHRLQLEDWLRGIDGAHGSARLGGDARRFARGAHDERHAARRRLTERPIQRRRVAPIEPAVDVIAGDADDGQPRLVRAGAHPLAERIRRSASGGGPAIR